jgi:hypothetical protein
VVQANYSLVAATVMAPNSHNWRIAIRAGDVGRFAIFSRLRPGKRALKKSPQKPPNVDRFGGGDPVMLNTRSSRGTLDARHCGIAAKLQPDYLVNPNVSAEIVTRRPFYVIGEVQKPGNYAYVSDITAMNAIAMAGGFTRRARKNEFYIRRLYTDGKMVRIEANAGTVLQAGDTLEVRERLF